MLLPHCDVPPFAFGILVPERTLAQLLRSQSQSLGLLSIQTPSQQSHPAEGVLNPLKWVMHGLWAGLSRTLIEYNCRAYPSCHDLFDWLECRSQCQIGGRGPKRMLSSIYILVFFSPFY